MTNRPLPPPWARTLRRRSTPSRPSSDRADRPKRRLLSTRSPEPIYRKLIRLVYSLSTVSEIETTHAPSLHDFAKRRNRRHRDRIRLYTGAGRARRDQRDHQYRKEPVDDVQHRRDKTLVLPQGKGARAT